MRYPVSEALDRYSILWLKRFFGLDVEEELLKFEEYLDESLPHLYWPLIKSSLQLGTCNALQWMLEECVSPFEDDECVAQAAIEIRRSNIQRVAAKNALAQQLGGGFQDQRVRYPGAEILAHTDAEVREHIRETPGFEEWMRLGQRRRPGETFEGLAHLIGEADEEGARAHKLEADLQAIIDRNADACDYRATGEYDLAAFDAERAQREEEIKRLIAEAETLGKWELGAIAPRLHIAWVSAHGPSQAERTEAEARYYESIAFAGKIAPDLDTPIDADPLDQWRDLPKHAADDPSA